MHPISHQAANHLIESFAGRRITRDTIPYRRMDGDDLIVTMVHKEDAGQITRGWTTECFQRRVIVGVFRINPEGALTEEEDRSIATMAKHSWKPRPHFLHAPEGQ